MYSLMIEPPTYFKMSKGNSKNKCLHISRPKNVEESQVIGAAAFIFLGPCRRHNKQLMGRDTAAKQSKSFS